MARRDIIVTLAVDGNIVASDDVIDFVTFWIDDPVMSGPYHHRDSTAPFDVSGGSVTTAVPLDLEALGPGQHTITAAITLVGGGDGDVVHATFEYQPEAEPDPTLHVVVEVQATGFDVEADGTSHYPQNAIDNDLGTRWSDHASEFDGLAFPNNGAWIDFDLGSQKDIGGAAVAFYAGDQRQAWFDLLVSADRQTWTPVFHGLSSGQTVQHERFEWPRVTGRYLRYLGHRNSYSRWISITDVDVYDKARDTSILQVPAATITSLEPSTGEVRINWVRGYGIWAKSFQVQRALSVAGPWTTIAAAVSGTTHVDTDVAIADNTYYYRVVAKFGTITALPSNVLATGTTQPSIVAKMDLTGLPVGPVSRDTLQRMWEHGGSPGLDRIAMACHWQEVWLRSNSVRILDGSGSEGGIFNEYDGTDLAGAGRCIAYRHSAGNDYDGTGDVTLRLTGNVREAKLRHRIWWSNSYSRVGNGSRGKNFGLGSIGPRTLDGNAALSGGQSGKRCDLPPMHCADVREGDGWSARRQTHRDNGQQYLYFYHPWKPDGHCGRGGYYLDSGYDDGSNGHMGAPFGDANFPGDGPPSLPEGQWHWMEQHVDVDKGFIKDYLIDPVTEERTLMAWFQAPVDQQTGLNIMRIAAGATYGDGTREQGINCAPLHLYIGAKRAVPTDMAVFVSDVEVEQIRPAPTAPTVTDAVAALDWNVGPQQTINPGANPNVWGSYAIGTGLQTLKPTASGSENNCAVVNDPIPGQLPAAFAGQVLRVTYPGGRNGHIVGGLQVRFGQIAEAWVEYWVLHSTGWRTTPNVDGGLLLGSKLPGLAGAGIIGSATGAGPDTAVLEVEDDPPLDGAAVTSTDEGWSSVGSTVRASSAAGPYRLTGDTWDLAHNTHHRDSSPPSRWAVGAGLPNGSTWMRVVQHVRAGRNGTGYVEYWAEHAANPMTDWVRDDTLALVDVNELVFHLSFSGDAADRRYWPAQQLQRWISTVRVTTAPPAGLPSTYKLTD